MPFSVVVDPPALKEFKKIKNGAPQIFSRLIKAIDGLAHDPFCGKPLQGRKKGCYSIREGDYRVIYEVHVSDQMIHVIAIGHRKEIYR